jgi:putative membrane protein
MTEPRIIEEASFTNATRYFVVSTAVVLTCTVVMIPFMIIVLPIVYLAKSIEYKHIRCYYTPRFLKVHRGWLNKEEKTIPLDKITDLAVKQGPIMRRIGVEALQLETAGQSGSGSALVNLVGIEDARAFRDRVLEQRDRLAAAGDAPAAAASASAPSAGDPVLAEIRDTLLRIERRLPPPADADG